VWLCVNCGEDYVIYIRRTGVCGVYGVITALIDLHKVSVSIYFVSENQHAQVPIDLVLDAISERIVTLLFSGKLIIIIILIVVLCYQLRKEREVRYF
jgi:hypothetical protein